MRTIPSRLTQLFDRWHPPEQMILLFTALLVGIATGTAAILFRTLIRSIEWVGFDWIPATLSSGSNLYVLVVPALGGLLVGLLAYYVAQEAKGSGVPEVMEAVALRSGYIRPFAIVIKALASALSIGSGGSVGREGPIVYIGSAIGSSIAQTLRLSEARTANLVACGAAGGVAATFDVAVTRRTEIQRRTQEARLEHDAQGEFVELLLCADDPVIGRQLHQIASALPADCLLVSIRRRGRTFIPHGNTSFKVGDQVTAFVLRSEARRLFVCFKGRRGRQKRVG